MQPKKLVTKHQVQSRNWIDENCFLTSKQIKERCLAELNVNVSEYTINNCIQSFHYTIKRVHFLPHRRNDNQALEERAMYANRFMELLATVDDRKLFFFDEAGFSVSMRSKRGGSLARSGTLAVTAHHVGPQQFIRQTHRFSSAVESSH